MGSVLEKREWVERLKPLCPALYPKILLHMNNAQIYPVRIMYHVIYLGSSTHTIIHYLSM